MRRALQTFVLACSLGCGALLAPPAHGQDTSWLGGAGTWTDADHWDEGVPSTTSDARIDGDPTVASDVLLNALATIHSLTLDAGDLLRIGNGQRLQFQGAGAALANDGLIQHEGDGFTWIRLNSDLAVSGTGTIRLNGLSNAINGSASAVLMHGPEHTIEGTGGVGSGLEIVNQGLIHANVAGQSLTIDSASKTLTHTGTIRASNGGIVNLFAPNHTGSGGRYEALGAGSRVTFFSGGAPGPQVVGAVFDTADGGAILGAEAFNLTRTIALHDVINLGRFDGPDTRLHGSLENAGLLWVRNGKTLSVESDLAITGGGTIEIEGGTITGAFPFVNEDNVLAGFGDVDVPASFGADSTLAPGTAGDATRRFDFLDGLLLDGILAIDLGGTDPSQYDTVDVLGVASLGASALFEVDLLPGFTPVEGDAFDVLRADAIAVAGELDLDLPALEGLVLMPEILRLFDASAGMERDVLRITALVPEPGAALQLIACALALGALGRRQSSRPGL